MDIAFSFQCIILFLFIYIHIYLKIKFREEARRRHYSKTSYLETTFIQNKTKSFI